MTTNTENDTTISFDLYDAEAVVRRSYTQSAVDALIYYLYDVDLSDAEREVVKRALLGDLKPALRGIQEKNQELVTADFCAQYAQLRSLGLSQRDAATSLGITIHRLESLLQGHGLSAEQHAQILHAESVAEAALKRRCLNVIDEAIARGKTTGWRAAMALLEKKFPAEYGNKLEVNSTTKVNWSASDCEAAARQARLDLERIRRERRETAEISEEDLYIDTF